MKGIGSFFLRSAAGLSTIETLVAVSLVGILAVGVTNSVNHVTYSRAKIMRENIALAFASDKLEELALVNPNDLTDADDETETLTSDNMEFTRVTDITVNADLSRTAVVTVTSNVVRYQVSVTVSSSFPQWGIV